jgi:signal transduction histidine kinase
MARALDQELAFFEYNEADRQALAAALPHLEKHADALVAAFYRHLLGFPETRRHLRDPKVAERLLEEQRAYLLSLAGPRIDEKYVEARRRIGEVHERVGLDTRWYLGAYSLYLSLLTPILRLGFIDDPERGERALIALQKLLLFDVHIAMERYIDRREQDLERLNAELARSGRQLARDLEATGVELRRTTERAHAAERLASMGALVAGLAHEVGTPMGVIQGHAKLLEPDVQSDDGRWRLRTIQEQIARISRIIQGLLNMARPGRTRLIPVTLEPVLESTLAFLDEKLGRRRIAATLEVPGDARVSGDPERLQQLFLNLFLNAADAMPEGGELNVTVRTGDEGDLEIRVADTGPGIPESELGRIFEPFFTTKSAGEGNGLGLAVAHGIAAEHGGLLEVAESGDSGTTFRILLPTETSAQGG